MVTRRHRAMSNFRASATIIVLRFLPALSVLVRYHRANALSFWKTKKRQANWIIPAGVLVHCPALASPFSRRLLPLLIRRAGKTSIALLQLFDFPQLSR